MAEDDYWGGSYWGGSYWGGSYWGEYGTAVPAPTVTPEVGVFRPPRRIRRIPLTLQGLLTAPLVVAEYSLDIMLLCDLLEPLVVEGLLSSTVLLRLREYAWAKGEVGTPLTESVVALGELGRELRERVLMEGKIPLFEILHFLKRLEETIEDGME